MNNHEKFLLFDFLSYISAKLNIKVDYLELIKGYEESRKHDRDN